jgi:16S rRNA (uracil1498-N3)-methyltransferase
LQDVFRTNDYPILIGPEGDFSLDEIETAQKAGYDFVTLGKNRLRTETAGLYACMQCLLIN